MIFCVASSSSDKLKSSLFADSCAIHERKICLIKETFSVVAVLPSRTIFFALFCFSKGSLRHTWHNIEKNRDHRRCVKLCRINKNKRAIPNDDDDVIRDWWMKQTTKNESVAGSTVGKSLMKFNGISKKCAAGVFFPSEMGYYLISWINGLGWF